MPAEPKEPRTELDLDLIETLARAATPGPYELRWPGEQEREKEAAEAAR